MNKNENQADTFRRLVTPYLNTLYKTAFRLTGSNEQAEDLVQDLLVKLYPKTREMEDIRQLSPWLKLELSGERKFHGFRLKLANKLSWIEARSPYQYLTGLENRLTAKLVRRITRGKIHAGMGFDYNDRDDLRTDQDGFFSYSPVRGDIHAGIDFLVSPELAFVFYGQYRKSYYPDKNTPADEKREDDRVLISRGGNTSYSSPLMPFCSTPVLTTIPACLNTATKAIVSCWD